MHTEYLEFAKQKAAPPTHAHAHAHARARAHARANTHTHTPPPPKPPPPPPLSPRVRPGTGATRGVMDAPPEQPEILG